ncbi:MAG: hypothetical protein JEZ08_01410 [Clostridiales bacterium]|nr:hypothetical protein [Clostridiales bacterium]
MWNCINCNHEMEDDVLNCTDCGSSKPDTFDENNESEEDATTKIYVLTSDDNTNTKIRKDKRERKKELLRRYGVLVDRDAISKEEYKELVKKSKQLRKPPKMKNYKSIYRVLKILGYFSFVFYFVAGIYLGLEIEMGTSDSFNWLIASTCFLVGLISGMILLGFGGVVKLMDDISKERKAS